MGLGSSKHKASGTLLGAYAPVSHHPVKSSEQVSLSLSSLVTEKYAVCRDRVGTGAFLSCPSEASRRLFRVLPFLAVPASSLCYLLSRFLTASLLCFLRFDHLPTTPVCNYDKQPLSNVPLPAKLHGKTKFYVKVPEGKRSGDAMVVAVRGEEVSIKIPVLDPPLRGGDKFAYEHPADVRKVIASTLPSLPGTIIVESKPILWASVTHSYYRYAVNDQNGQVSMGKAVGRLLQECQAELLEKTIEVGCHAVLGVNTNITVDSTGERGDSKLVIVTMTGTPCNVVPTSQLPAVQAEAVEILPMTNY